MEQIIQFTYEQKQRADDNQLLYCDICHKIESKKLFCTWYRNPEIDICICYDCCGH